MRLIQTAALALAALILAACGRDVAGTGPVPTTIVILPPSANIDALGGTQTFQVTVRDQNGEIMEGQTIEWSAALVAVASISTEGTATAHANGTTQITAKSGTLQTNASLIVQQQVQSLAKIAGDNQQGTVGMQLPNALRVAARDRRNNPVAGAQIVFEVSPNGGTLSAATVITDAAGEASVLWTLSNVASTSHTVTARANGMPATPVVFNATAVAQSSDNSEFNIDLQFLTEITPSQRAIFNNAAARWQSVVVGDLAPVLLTLGPGDCGSNSPAFSNIVDDLVIFVSLEPIDDVGKTLGSAGPCRVRNANLLPVAGLMRFDIADIAALESNNLLEAVILHEMGHVLGIGSIWSLKGFLQNPSLPSSPGVDTFFSGANAIAAFNTVGGANYSGQKVPVENTQGDAGTRDSHWRESVFSNELMTGFVGFGLNPLSLVTVRSLQDLGYIVNAGAADTYFLPGTGAAREPLPSVHLYRDISTVPIRIVGR